MSFTTRELAVIQHSMLNTTIKGDVAIPFGNVLQKIQDEVDKFQKELEKNGDNK